MNKIRIEEGRELDAGTCNWCDVEMDDDGMPTHRDGEVKLVHFDNFCLRLCSAHYHKMLVAWLRLVVSELFPE